MSYVHGYSEREAQRLQDQAGTLVDLLHRGTSYPPGARVLEAGCGVGAQTVTLAARSPGAHFTAMDRDEASLAAARRAVSAAGHRNVEFLNGDLRALPFADATFDHAFACFVLEHVPGPASVLRELSRVIRPGSTLTVIEDEASDPPLTAERASLPCGWPPTESVRHGAPGCGS
ncbi:MAG: class I SAM-dependent methyltransferase [Polyangiaceae bacterium]|nr:class I SAM-dependent methyltransferase [Polyangiaceae bacterium]